tara:strand:- start:19731 stop:20288 length:558 start_codon:yes stop_codon:yes gene_type:complete
MKKEINISDSALVIELQKGNKKVLPLLVKRWHLSFCKLAFFYVKDADVAKDIAQESWIVIIDKMNDLKEPGKCKSWAISIVNRKAIDWLRKTNRERAKLQSVFAERQKVQFEVEESNELKVKKQLILAISKLSVNQQQVIKLFYGQGYSLKEVSEIMNTTVGNTKSRLFHAREKLKTILKHKNHG